MVIAPDWQKYPVVPDSFQLIWLASWIKGDRMVVAEGVETQQVWDRLASIGCDGRVGVPLLVAVVAAA
jgi:hypothetical protein